MAGEEDGREGRRRGAHDREGNMRVSRRVSEGALKGLGGEKVHLMVGKPDMDIVVWRRDNEEIQAEISVCTHRNWDRSWLAFVPLLLFAGS